MCREHKWVNGAKQYCLLPLSHLLYWKKLSREEIFVVQALPQDFQISRKFIFVDETIPQISRELIFADTGIGKKRNWKKKKFI